MGRFSLKNKILSAVSGDNRLRSGVKMSPAVLNKRSTSTEVREIKKRKEEGKFRFWFRLNLGFG